MPTTGAAGRVRRTWSQARFAGLRSLVGLTVERAGIDAGIETLRIVDGVMQDPTGPWVVAWYENLGSLGRDDNVVIAGHIDYWNVGPAVFYNMRRPAARRPDRRRRRGRSKTTRTPSNGCSNSTPAIPLEEMAGPTDEQALTLITCGGAFDYANGQYFQRTVVRAASAGPGQTATV